MDKQQNKYSRIMIAVLLIILMVFSAGCSHQPAKPIESTPDTTQNTKPATDATTVPTTEDTFEITDASLNSLRQAMVGTSQFLAVAYFGYHDTIDSDAPVDPYEVMTQEAPQLCADVPFLLDIPADRVIGECGELYCIVPLDTDAQITVSLGTWDEVNEEYIYEEALYFSETGEPILLFCNGAGWEPDTQLFISGPSGDVIWYPQLDDNLCAMPLENENWEELLYDFSPYREMLMKDHREMKDTAWVMPTAEMLNGTTWSWETFLNDSRYVYCSVAFQKDTLSVRWNDGIDEEDHEFPDAAWELTYDEGFAILEIDFREMAGVLRYNLLYSEVWDYLYFGMDVVQEEMPIGWELLHRYMVQTTAPDPVLMAGSWELLWTELEGYREEAEPGTCFLEITTDYEGLYWVSYTDYALPDENYTDKELVVFPFEMYYGCGNDQWTATVNYTGKYGTEYNITLLSDGTLLLQRYWEVDGARMVSYGSYSRVTEYG